MKGEKDVKVYLDDILESIKKIKKYVEGLSEEEFYDKDQVQDSVLRRLEIIGEAVSNLPKEFKEEHSGVPWREISGMRNVLIHEYFGVNMERVWKVVEEDLPELERRVEEIKKSSNFN